MYFLVKKRISIILISVLISTLSAFAASDQVQISAGKEGFSITSQNGYGIKFKGFAQSVGYFGINDRSNLYEDQFLLRRARIDTRVKLGQHIEGRIHGDFAPRPKLLDAYFQLNLHNSVSLRIGQFKSPLSQERQRSAPSLLFNDFAYTASLAPNRDIGIQLSGKVAKGILNYQIAYINGAQDGLSSEGDNSDHKEISGRFYFSPFVNMKQNIFKTLAIGAGSSWGEHRDEALGSIRTPSRTKVFSYNESSKGNGRVYRISPQFRWFAGRYSMIGEFMIADHEVSNTSGMHADLRNRAWTFSAGYVLFGGKRTEKGLIIKEAPDLSNKHFGAMELVARIHGFQADEETFNGFASSLTSVERIVTMEGGLNWYVAANTCIKLIYSHSSFSGGAVSGDREPEQTLSLSTNIAF